MKRRAGVGDSVPVPARWERVLYKQQPWPDNHTSPAFLASLTINDNVVVRQFAPVVVQACPVLQHLATLVFVGCQTCNLYMVSGIVQLLRGCLQLLSCWHLPQ